MTIVNKFNVNKQQVTFDADIIENMSANDVSYNTKFQYDENTVGNKLSKLESEVIYDVSAHNNGATFLSLTALLSDENLSTLIPSTVRCGGMSIRFVQSSDNKYVQYMYKETDVTTVDAFINPANWNKTNFEEEVNQLNINCLDLGFPYKISGRGVQQKHNLFFKKDVLYTCTLTIDRKDIFIAEIRDDNDIAICGLSILDGDSSSRTNTFTPSADTNGYFIVKYGTNNWNLIIEQTDNIVKILSDYKNNVVKTLTDTERRLLSYNLDFYYADNTKNTLRINGLEFKKGITYTCTHETDSQEAYCAIMDNSGTVVCGLSITGTNLSRTNTFTPKEDITEGYIDFKGNNHSIKSINYSIKIVASKNIVSEVKQIKNDIADNAHSVSQRVVCRSKNLYSGERESSSTILSNYGNTTSMSGFTTSDYVPVLPNATYSTTNGQTLRKVCFYNKYKDVPCIDFTENIGTFTTPENTYYIRFSMFDVNVGNVILVKGGTAAPYTPYNPIEGYINESVVKRNGEFSDNILDESAVVLLNKFMYNDGTLLDSNNHATLDFFEVKPNTEYSCSEECGTFRKVCCFDSSKTFIIGGFFEHISTFTTPSNCKYVRVSVPMSSVDYIMLTEGINIKMYSPYNEVQGYLNHDIFTYMLVDEIKQLKMQEWSILRFGLFIHWGVYSAWAGKYDGLDINGDEIHRTDGTEWMWHNFKIPKETYKAKASDFSSDGWNPEKICYLAKSVGMKYIVLTIRHHEGFSLIPTPYCEWDITDSSANNDVVMQLKNACDRHGLKFCVYISALLDWNDEGGFGQQQWNSGSDPYTESEHLSFTDKQVSYCRQINDTYKPFSIWFDGGTYIDQPNSVRHLFIQKQTAYFPFVITNDRGSHREGDWIEVEDGVVDHPNYTKPLEKCNHISGWGYTKVNDNIKIMNKLEPILFDMMETMGRGFNYLLNVPPTGDGTISDNYVNWFVAASAFFRKYTFFTDAKRLFNNCQPSWGRPIYRNNSIFMFILPNGSSNVYLDSIDTGNLIGVHVYNIQNPDDQENYEVISNDRLLLKNIPTKSDDYFICVRLDFNGNVVCNDYNIVDTSINPMSMVVVSRKNWPNYNTGVQYNTKQFVIGDGNSISKTRFKYIGETGNKTIELVMESSGSNNIGINILDEAANIGDSSDGSTISTDLTNGHIYTLTLTKSGNGDGRCVISNISIS